MIVRATLAALSFVSHSPTAVAAVVVSSPLHILVQQVLRPLERQLLMVRPGFEPQACRAPTRRGIYLFSVIVDTMQVRCAIAESLSSRCLCCRACLVACSLLGSCRARCTHSTLHSTLTSPMFCTCAQAQKLGTR